MELSCKPTGTDLPLFISIVPASQQSFLRGFQRANQLALQLDCRKHLNR